MDVVSHKVPVTTDAAGAATEYTPLPVCGKIEHVRYTPDPTAPLDTGADLDITGDSSGIVVANHDDIGTSAFTRAYRQAVHGPDGAALTYDGTRGVFDHVVIDGERLKIVIANGGNAKSGTFEIIVTE